MRIAFDIDGVLADMESGLVAQAEALFGEATTARLETGDVDAVEAEAAPDAAASPTDDTPPLDRLRLTPRQRRRLWRHVQTIENFWERLKEIEPDVIARLASITADRRWEIIFLTKRPETAGATAQLQTQRWLESKGFALPSVYVVQGSRGRIAASLDLDIVVDDRPENCLDVVVDSKARAILVCRGDEKQLPAAMHRLGIVVVKSVAECLDVLTHVDAAGKDTPGVMSRVRRLLGLKEPAGA
jgi:hypothetical protein